MCLTVLVPYIVSTVSSVATQRELAARRDSKENKETADVLLRK
jgi:hypothetical protein